MITKLIGPHHLLKMPYPTYHTAICRTGITIGKSSRVLHVIGTIFYMNGFYVMLLSSHKVLSLIRSCPDAQGISTQDLKQSLSGMSLAVIK